MLVLWLISLIIGILFIVKSERVADIWRSTEFAINEEGGKRRKQLMRRSGFWKLLGIIILIISIFLLAGGDTLFVSKSTEAILKSTPKEQNAIQY